MERRAFVKLAAASPVIVSPVCAGCSDGNPDGDASGTVSRSEFLTFKYGDIHLAFQA